LLDDISRLGSLGREHAAVKEKPKKDKDRHKDHKEKSGKDKSLHGDVVLRSSFSWDSSQGEFPAFAELRFGRVSCHLLQCFNKKCMQLVNFGATYLPSN